LNIKQAQNPPEQRLLSAVVSLAVKDCCDRPIKIDNKIRLSFNAASAFDFIFTESCEGYLEMLDIDPTHFRSALLKLMANDGPKEIASFDSMARRTFRQNHALWSDLNGRLGRRVVDDEEKDWFIA
jgi:hypothetical protein